MVKAAFPDLGPVGNEWDADWRKMVERLLTALDTFGKPTLLTEIEAYKIVPRSGFAAVLDYFPFDFFWEPLRKRLSLSLIEQLLLATDDDQFGAAIVGFGEPPRISLRMGFGHPIFWLILPQDSWESALQMVLNAVADGRRMANSDVDWRTWFDS